MQLNLHEINKLVINLPERSDRILKFKDEFAKLFSDKFEVVNGVRKQPVHQGIAEAHLNCIRKAQANGWDKVLIMEDDLIITPKAKEYTDKIFKEIPEDWDILLGGIYWTKMAVPKTKYWNKVSEFCALHFYIVNDKAYDKLLTYDGNQHYDRWIGSTGLKCYVPKKFFAIQEDGYSDNVNKVTNYNSTYLRNFEILK